MQSVGLGLDPFGFRFGATSFAVPPRPAPGADMSKPPNATPPLDLTGRTHVYIYIHIYIYIYDYMRVVRALRSAKLEVSNPEGDS